MNSANSFFDPNSKRFWYGLMIFRIFLALNSRTRFHADEHQQSVEVAYHMVYGGGCLPWEWNPNHALRQIFHPLIYASIFKLLNILHIDFTILIIYLPNILHAVFLFWCDYRFYILVKKIYNYRIAKLSLFIYCISWFSSLLMIKTFSNTIEAGLLIIGISYWYKIKETQEEIQSKPKIKNSDTPSLIDSNAVMLTLTITSTFILRTTSIIPWLLPMIYMVFYLKTFLKFLLCGLFLALPLLLFSIVCDSLYYSRPTLTFLNFLHFNVLTEGSNYFGVSSHFEYVTLFGFLQMHVFYLLMVAGAIFNAIWHFHNKQFPMFLCVAGFYLLVLSMIAHKEIRFALPIFHMYVVFIAFGINWLCQRKCMKLIKLLLCLYVIVNASVFAFMTQFYAVSHKVNDYLNDQKVSSLYYGAFHKTKTLCDLNFGYETKNIITWNEWKPPVAMKDKSIIQWHGKDLREDYFVGLIHKIETNEYLPQYIVMNDSANYITQRKVEKWLSKRYDLIYSHYFEFEGDRRSSKNIDKQGLTLGLKSVYLRYNLVYRLRQ